jgi:hypothetical protein
MSQDEHPEPASPGADARRVLSPGDLVDLRVAHDRALTAIPEAILAFRCNDGESMLAALGAVMSGLDCIRTNLALDDIDDDDDDEPIANLERVTTNGGRADG